MKIKFNDGRVAVIPHVSARSKMDTELLCEDMKALILRPATFQNRIIGSYIN